MHFDVKSGTSGPGRLGGAAVSRAAGQPGDRAPAPSGVGAPQVEGRRHRAAEFRSHLFQRVHLGLPTVVSEPGIEILRGPALPEADELLGEGGTGAAEQLGVLLVVRRRSGRRGCPP